MTDLFEFLFSYVAIWAPSLIAVLGVVYSILTALKKSKDAIEEFKDNTLLKELTEKIGIAIKENHELRKQNSLLLDEITKIKNFVEKKKEEEKTETKEE